MSTVDILVIDDEASVRFSLKQALSSPGVRVEGVETARAGLEAIAKGDVDLVLLDVRLPDQSGLDALRAVRLIDQRLPVVVMTAHGTTDTAIEATKRGAFDYLLKPFDLAQLRSVTSAAIEAGRMARSPAAHNREPIPGDFSGRMIGRSAVMQEVFKAIGRVANSDVNVLLLGESGVGKELVARAIYKYGRRAQQPFIAVNCAAIPESSLESELFGHEPGAFSGAELQRLGRFEQAAGGTVLLDEVGDMSPAIQAKVLRLLQDQQFERVGGRETIHADVRLIAATNQNLAELVAAGKFRQDLFYRLNTYTISLPPLRARRDDLPLLVAHLIAVHATEIGKNVRTAAAETLQLLAAYPWPGNVRELQGVVKTAIVNATSDVLTPDCLPEIVRNDASGLGGGSSSRSVAVDVAASARRLVEAREDDVYRKILLAVDQVVLHEVLKYVGGNQVEASRLLGISRTTLRAKLQLLNQNSPTAAAESHEA